MNVAFDLQEVDIQNSIRFLDKRNNIIMDGDFTKLMYSDHCITVNGLYLHFPIRVALSPNVITTTVTRRTHHLPPPPGLLYVTSDLSTNIKRSFLPCGNKLTITFHPSAPENTDIIQDMITCEKGILDYYKQCTGSTTPCVYQLKTQLFSGNMKFYRDYDMNTISQIDSLDDIHYVIKISGVWETRNSMGITYKLLELYTPPKVT